VRLLIGFSCSAVAAIAGMFLPFIVHGVRNLPWEAVFGSAFYVTWYFRSVLGERVELLVGGLLWPVAVIALVCFAACRLCTAHPTVRLISCLLFIGSLLVCVPFETANSLAACIPLYLNETNVRF
jgi:hypothetical protein